MDGGADDPVGADQAGGGRLMAKINTISAKQMADLQRRAQKAAPPWTSDKAIQQRKHHAAQQAKANQS